MIVAEFAIIKDTRATSSHSVASNPKYGLYYTNKNFLQKFFGDNESKFTF